MSEATTQTVVKDADTQAAPASEAEGARNQGDDLDALLADFDSSTKPTDTKPQPPQPAATQTAQPVASDDRIRALEGIATQWQQDKFRKEISETVKEIRGDVSSDVIDDDLIESWLDARARKDPRLAQAWLQKDANPRQWSKIQSELGREFKKKFDKAPDRQVTEDRAAVVAAVRGASTRVPADPAPNLGAMTNAEFEAYKAKLGM